MTSGMARFWLAGFMLALTLGAQEPETQPTQRPVRPESKEEDPGRPVLRRGGPSTKREEVAPPANPSAAQPPIVKPGSDRGDTATPPKKPSAAAGQIEVDEEGRAVRPPSGTPGATPGTGDLVERAREEAALFLEGLPNFICDQLTNRYKSKTLKPDWKYQDRVQVELIYAGGKEDYRNIKINGKPVKKGSPEDSGTWSTGEFGTILNDVLHPTTDAKFKPRGDSTAAGLAAKVYDFSVVQPNSHWTIRFGRAVQPAYRGALWIDPKTARVLRIEMNSKQLPRDYDIDTVEATVDYGWVTISGNRYLLPVKSENLACFRGTFDCVRNEIEFRNYRKFQVESQVLQVESEVTFPEADDPKKPKPKTVPPSITPEEEKPPAKKDMPKKK